MTYAEEHPAAGKYKLWYRVRLLRKPAVLPEELLDIRGLVRAVLERD
jgi:hypothetical protein